MGRVEGKPTIDPEIAAMSTVIDALKDLDQAAQQRVINYAITRLTLDAPQVDQFQSTNNAGRKLETPPPDSNEASGTATPPPDDGLQGINPVARKWMTRNDLAADRLSKLFSLGIDEIDLVASKVPGKNKKDRMRSVILLKAVASYLGGGAARVTHEEVKEACLHYNAFDTDNFANYLKKMAAEVGGTKEAGYTLTARGLTNATELVKSILAGPT